MNMHIVIPMPTEAQLQEWERGITRTISKWSIPYRLAKEDLDDTAGRDHFGIAGERNTIIEIRAEDGQVLYP